MAPAIKQIDLVVAVDIGGGDAEWPRPISAGRYADPAPRHARR
jgi:hypothetical protein